MPPTKAPAWAIEFAQFIAASAKIAYNDLPQHFSDSQWKYRLVHRATIPSPDGAAIVETDLLIGPSIDKLEYFDTLTMKMPPNIAPLTLITRQNLVPTMLSVVFGRLPPVQDIVVPQPGPGQVNGGDVHLTPEQAGVTAANDGGEYVDEGAALPNVVERREPDGLPIFTDLYSMDGALKGASTGDTIDAVLEEVRDFLAMAQSLEQVDALALKNPNLRTFIKDFGDDQDTKTLADLVTSRRRQLTVPAAAAAAANAPRRRVRAQAN